MGDKVAQEFYCAVSGGGCGGYITFPLNMALNMVVEVVCPKCGHEHRRRIKDGVLTEDSRYSSAIAEQVTPPLPAWHQESNHPDSKKRAGTSQEREAVVIKEDPIARGFLKDRWFEIFGAR